MTSDQTWQYSASPHLKAIRQKLEARFGHQFRLLPSKPEWLTFQVRGLTDEVLIRTLEREQHQVFGIQLLNFQIVCDLKGKERGVSIRYLLGGSLSGDPGFWYY